MGSYVPSTREQRQEMLDAIGLKDFRELYRDVPQSMYLDRPLDLPEIGDAVTAGEAFGDVESVKAVSDLNSPVSGVVCAINEELVDSPELLNSDCYGAWIIKVENVTDEEDLLDSTAYEAFCAEEG